MLKSIRFIRDYRCFKKDDAFTFRPGINLLVGEQGTGKSTLINIVRDEGKGGKTKDRTITLEATPIKMMAFDFEKDTPRGKSYFNDDMDMIAQVQCLFVSHGEMNNAILKALGTHKEILFMMDEPDMALSIRSCHKLVGLFKKAAEEKCQVIAAVHNPIIIEAFPEVLSLEHRKWMTSKDFIDAHKGG